MNNNYSVAFFELAKETNTLEKSYQSFSQFYQIFQSEKEIKNYLSSPLISVDDKKKIIDQMTDDSDFKYFLDVIIDNGEMNELEDIYLSFKNSYQKFFRIKEVIIKTNKHLDEKELLHLKNILDKKYPEYQIELIEVIDEEELFGYEVFIDSKRISINIKDNVLEMKKNI